MNVSSDQESGYCSGVDDDSEEEWLIPETSNTEKQTLPLDSEITVTNVRREIKTRLFGNLLILLVWVGMLCGSITLHLKYRDECTNVTGFSTLGLCLLALLTVRHATSCSLYAASLYYVCRIFHKKSRTITDVPPTDPETSAPTLYCMQNIYSQGLQNEKPMKSTIHTGVLLDRAKFGKTLLAPQNFSMPSSSPSSKNLAEAVLSLKQVAKKTSAYNCSKAQNFNDANRRRLIWTMGCFDAVPLFSIIVYITVGAETPFAEAATCHDLLIFNWVVVGIFIVHNAICILAAYIHWMQ